MTRFVIAAIFLVATTLQGASVPVGAPAPAFALPDQHGQSRSLSDYRGRFVVLEWHENGCPYVNKHYATGHMQRLQREWMDKGIAWLLMSSSAEGFHSYLTAPEARAYLGKLNASPTAMLLDFDGRVGRAYSVLTALHMVIIDPSGNVIYNGGIDDKPTTNKSDMGTATNHVSTALTEALSGRKVSIATTQPYGCSIHYRGQ